MTRRIRFLTDSEIKKGQATAAMELAVQREELEKHRKKARFRSDATKIEAVKSYLALGGNASLTAGALGIPLPTINLWKTQNWWKNLVIELKKAEKLELSAKTKAIIDRSLDLLHDRLENGDAVFNPKTGEVQRKALPAATLNNIIKDMMDRKNILDRAFDEKVVETTKGDKLAALAERFAKLAETALDAKKPQVNVTDVVYVTEKEHTNA